VKNERKSQNRRKGYALNWCWGFQNGMVLCSHVYELRSRVMISRGVGQ